MSQINMIFTNCGEEGIRTLGAETAHTLSKRALSTTQTPHLITRHSLEQKIVSSCSLGSFDPAECCSHPAHSDTSPEINFQFTIFNFR